MVLGEEAAANMVKEKEVATTGSTMKADRVDETAKANSSSTTAVQAEETSKSTADHDDEKKLSVLIVDDCSITRILHWYKVTNLGLEAHLAVNGKEAVDLHRSGASFDLILMDMQMPIMNGVQATKELRAMGVDTMIVGVTGGDDHEQQIFLEAGLNDCYSKPLDDGKFFALVQAIRETNEKGK